MREARGTLVVLLVSWTAKTRRTPVPSAAATAQAETQDTPSKRGFWAKRKLGQKLLLRTFCIFSTDFNPTMILFSTIRSSRNPSSWTRPVKPVYLGWNPMIFHPGPDQFNLYCSTEVQFPNDHFTKAPWFRSYFHRQVRFVHAAKFSFLWWEACKEICPESRKLSLPL